MYILIVFITNAGLMTSRNFLSKMIEYVYTNYILILEVILQRLSQKSAKNEWLKKLTTSIKLKKKMCKSTDEICGKLKESNQVLVNIIKTLGNMKEDLV